MIDGFKFVQAIKHIPMLKTQDLLKLEFEGEVTRVLVNGKEVTEGCDVTAIRAIMLGNDERGGT